MPNPDRHAGRPHHLESPDQTQLIARKKTPGSRLVELGQSIAKRYAAKPPMEVDRLLPDLLGNFGNRREAFFERAQIETRAADHDRQVASICRRGDFADGEPPPLHS